MWQRHMVRSFIRWLNKEANYDVAVKSNAKLVRIFVSTSNVCTDNAQSGMSDFKLDVFVD